MSAPGGSVYVDDTTSVNRIFNGRLSYNKGAYVLHMLRWVVGDSAFYQGVRNYLNGAGDFGTTKEFQTFMENASGKNLTEFLADWFYGQGYPSYHLQWSQQADSLIFTLGQTQSHPSVSFFEMPVPVRVKLNGIDSIFVLQNTTNNQRFSFQIGNASVDSIAIDPDIWLLSKNNTIEQVITATGDPATSEEVNVFPNPAHNEINIISAEHVQSVQIIDVSGRTFSLPVTGNKVNVSQFSPGLYSLLIKNKTGDVIAIKRIILF